MDEYQTETGEIFPDVDAARVVRQALDEDTIGRVDDHEDLKITIYLPFEAWILERDVKLKLRKHTRVKPSVNSPDDMVYGVDDAQPSAEQAAPQQAAAFAADPWHGAAAASDPWAAPPGPPGEGAAAAAWPPLTPEWPGGD